MCFARNVVQGGRSAFRGTGSRDDHSEKGRPRHSVSNILQCPGYHQNTTDVHFAWHAGRTHKMLNHELHRRELAYIFPLLLTPTHPSLPSHHHPPTHLHTHTNLKTTLPNHNQPKTPNNQDEVLRRHRPRHQRPRGHGSPGRHGRHQHGHERAGPAGRRRPPGRRRGPAPGLVPASPSPSPAPAGVPPGHLLVHRQQERLARVRRFRPLGRKFIFSPPHPSKPQWKVADCVCVCVFSSAATARATPSASTTGRTAARTACPATKAVVAKRLVGWQRMKRERG